MTTDPDGKVLLEGTPEYVVWRRLCFLGCTTPVDPYDNEDCGSVAVEAVAALREAGMIKDSVNS